MLDKQIENRSYQNLDKKKKILSGRGRIFSNLLFGLILISSISFLICTNDISIKGFVIKDLQKQLRTLSNETAEIEIRIAELKTLDKIYDRAQDLKMVKVDKIEYIVKTDTSVAKK